MGNKHRIVMGLVMGKADSSGKMNERLKPSYMKCVVDASEVWAPAIYIDDSVNNLRKEAHKVVDMICDAYENNTNI